MAELTSLRRDLCSGKKRVRAPSPFPLEQVGWPWWATRVREAGLSRPERGSSPPYGRAPGPCGSRPAALEPSDACAVQPGESNPWHGCATRPDGGPLSCDKLAERPPGAEPHTPPASAPVGHRPQG